ncbi:hypothetical protein UCMB321_3874 [Pseudomonas batumici]|uniref:Uncharacterized protein n=1 Tax=Pseudomonas batumici TaxID=226910 RepID=A0A0C2I652_9PSED|nr:hypothetical protein UCMB321_3874 [Pseudomonas batumici]
MPVEQLGLGTQQDSFGQRSGTRAEVIGSFAHIHSRYAFEYTPACALLQTGYAYARE